MAALTRMTGVLVLAPAILTLLGREKPLESPLGPSLARTGKRLLRALPCLLLPLLGTLGYLALNYAVDGDPFAFLTHQEHWYQGPMWVSRVLRYVWDYLLHFWNASNGWAIWLPTLLLVPAVLRPPPLGDPPGPAGQPGASGLRLLLSDGQLLPVLAALRRAVPVLRVRVLPAGGQPHGRNRPTCAGACWPGRRCCWGSTCAATCPVPRSCK